MNKLEEKYGLASTLSLVIGCVIGAGIFFKVDDILTATKGNILAGLIGWIIVGLSVISGAIALSYYASLLPKEGGLLKYSDFRFGKKASFFVGWFYMTIYYPLLGSVLFTVGSEFLVYVLNNFEFINIQKKPLIYTIMGFISFLIFFTINLKKPKISGIVQSISTVLKVMPLLIIATIGIGLLCNGDIAPENTISNSVIPQNGNSLLSLTLASFIPIAFAFDGWYIATQISGEVKNSKKNLPIALIAGTVIVMVIYIFYYLGIVFDLGGDLISTLGNSYISTYAENLAGKKGNILINSAIVISILGAGNGIIMAGLRVPYQLANSGSAKNFLNVRKIDKKTQMPTNSAYLFLTISLVYLIIYYITSTVTFFKEIKFDLSSLPVTFVYVIMTCLYIGLFKLIKENKLTGNKTVKIAITIVALLGSLIVLYGGISSSNGLIYIIISLLILGIGFTVIKSDN